jgi:hypothetical protein
VGGAFVRSPLFVEPSNQIRNLSSQWYRSVPAFHAAETAEIDRLVVCFATNTRLLTEPTAEAEPRQDK